MQVLIEQSGSSISVPIPASVLNATGLQMDAPVDVRAENGRIIIAPSAANDGLESLLAHITPDNLHAEVDFGPACGHETL